MSTKILPPHKLFISEAMATSRDEKQKVLGKKVLHNDLMSMLWRGNDKTKIKQLKKTSSS